MSADGPGSGAASGLGGSSLLPPRRRPAAAATNMKRNRPMSGDDLVRLGAQTSSTGNETGDVSVPLVPLPKGGPHAPAESIAQYMEKVKAAAASNKQCPADFVVKESIDEDGLYIHKRPIRGLGSGSPLAIAGSLFHHTLIYCKIGGKLFGLDYGPSNMQDVTDNIMEEADARPVLMNGGNEVSVPAEDSLPFLHVRVPLHSLKDRVIQEAMAFCGTKKYHVVHNNCIHACDFLVRVLTGGLVRSAPLIYDAFCGEYPPMDPPMLMMLPLLLQKTWHQVCDGSALMAEFISTHSFPAVVAGVDKGTEPGVAAKRQEHQAALEKQQKQEQPRGKAAETEQDGTGASDGAGDGDAEFNDYNYWRRPIFQLDSSLVPEHL